MATMNEWVVCERMYVCVCVRAVSVASMCKRTHPCEIWASAKSLFGICMRHTMSNEITSIFGHSTAVGISSTLHSRRYLHTDTHTHGRASASPYCNKFVYKHSEACGHARTLFTTRRNTTCLQIFRDDSACGVFEANSVCVCACVVSDPWAQCTDRKWEFSAHFASGAAKKGFSILRIIFFSVRVGKKKDADIGAYPFGSSFSENCFTHVAHFNSIRIFIINENCFEIDC